MIEWIEENETHDNNNKCNPLWKRRDMRSRLHVMWVPLKDGAIDATSSARSSNNHAQIEITTDFPSFRHNPYPVTPEQLPEHVWQSFMLRIRSDRAANGLPSLRSTPWFRTDATTEIDGPPALMDCSLSLQMDRRVQLMYDRPHKALIYEEAAISEAAIPGYERSSGETTGPGGPPTSMVGAIARAKAVGGGSECWMMVVARGSRLQGTFSFLGCSRKSLDQTCPRLTSHMFDWT